MTPASICAAIEVALNRTLRLEPEVLADLAPLQGRMLAVTVEGLDWSVFVEFLADGVRVANSSDRAADAHLTGGAVALSRLAAGAARGEHALPPGVQLRGEPELFQRFATLLRRVGFDPAEVLAKAVGDGAAHRIVGGVRSFFGWGQKSAATLALNSAEYLREETRDLARRADVEEWMDAIDTLRDDSARLEARIRRLESSPAAAE